MIPRRTTSIDKTLMLNGNFTQHDTTVGASHINKHAAPETLRVSMTSQVDYKFIDKNVQPWGGDPSTASKFFKQFKSVASKLGYTPFINGQVVIGLPQDLLQASLALTQAQLTDDLNEAQVQHPQTPSQAQDAQEGEEKETQDQPADHSTDTTPAQAGSTHPTPPSSTIEFKQGVDVRKIIQDLTPLLPPLQIQQQ